MKKTLRVLIVEDREDDALLILRALQKSGCEPSFERVETEEGMRVALRDQLWDLVLSDYHLPRFNGMAALRLLKETGLDLPFILVSGAIGEETAVEIMKAGANDCVMKENLQRLAPAVERELRDAAVRRERLQAEQDKRRAEREWKNIFQAIGSPTVILDPRHRILAANRAVLRASGLSETELIGKSCHEIFHGTQRDTPAPGCPLVRLLETGETQTCPMEMEAFGGAYLVTCTPILDEQGRLERIIHIATDITERKRMETALTESERRYRAFINASKDMVYIKDDRFRHLLANQALADYFGKTPEELIGKTDFDLMPVAAAEQCRAADLEVLKTNSVVISEERVGDRVFETTKFPVPLQGGGITLGGMIRDITERKRAVEALRASEEQLAGAMEMAHLGHWEYDVEKDLFTFNDQFYKIFRTTAEEVGGYTLHSGEYARRFVHPDDRHHVAEETRKAIETDDPRFSRTIEHRLLYADGTVGEIVVRIFIVKDSQGRTVKTYGVNQDVTELRRVERVLRESEERYRLLFDHSQDAILMTQPDGTILDANPAACRMFGRSLEEIREVGRNGLVDGTDPRLQEALKRRETEGGGTAEITMVRANGSKFPVEISSRIFTDEAGQKKNSMIIRDITERKRVEESLFRERDLLQKTLHFFRNPDASDSDLASFIINECVRITESRLGFFGFVNPDETVMSATLYSERAMGDCAVNGSPVEFSITGAGIWAEAIRQRKPVTINDYLAPNPLKKGLPEGHLPIARLMVVPIVQEGRVIAAAGVANKPEPYAEHDLIRLHIFLENVWVLLQRKRAEEALRERDIRFKKLSAHVPGMIYQFMRRPDGTYCMPFTTEAIKEIFGCPPESVSEDFSPIARAVLAEDLDRLIASIEASAATLTTWEWEYRVQLPGRPIRWLLGRSTPQKLADGAIVWNGFNMDVTERRQTEEAIRRNEARLEGLLRISQHQARSIQELLDFALDEAIRLTDSRIGYIYLYDDRKQEFTLNTWSKGVMEACSIQNPPTAYLLEKTGLWGEAVRQAVPIMVNDFQGPHPLKRGYPEGHAPLYRYLTVPVFSRERIVAVAAVANKPSDYDESDVRQLTLLMDAVWRIVEERRSAEALRQAEEKYRGIFENAQEGIFQVTADGRYITANRAQAAMLGYDSPEDLLSSVTHTDEQLFVDPEARRELLLRIDEQGAVAGQEHRLRRKDGSVIWVSVNQYAVRDEEGRVLHYEGFNEDITERKMSLDRLHKAMGALVQALTVSVEVRDPYTAGHQRRVADLARAIAQKMGLPDTRIEGLRLAATIHDIGKLSVPAEILSKPTRLSPMEFNLIKVHPEAGYNILKDIEFPWPVARIVLEHHERLDGSGYPQGLTGDRLLPESRILAVADVLESMASHRPYRPAVGIEAALEEIERHKGVLYDAAVVEACTALFREKGFVLT